MDPLGEVRALHLALDAGAWTPTASDRLLAKLVEADLRLVTADSIRTAFAELGNASGPLADALKQVEVSLSGLTAAAGSSYQREVRSAAGAILRAVFPRIRDTETRPL
ncbi:hypothetical protein [Streptomyces flavidovirens]|uniref:Uncharacterized protein n=1 Tax=Streptomyces flavidovirens TaxID=67298 RepID=A0ABW6R8J6_9ACTN